MSTFVPVIIGVGDVVNRSLRLEDAKEPADLISQAIQIALLDTGLTNSTITASLLKNIDSLSVVRTWTWEYPDLPGLLSTRLGVDPTYKIYSHNAGDRPTKYLDEAARRIATGRSKVAIVTGGEALASLTAFAKADSLPPPNWTKTESGVDGVFSPTTVSRSIEGYSKAHSIGAPIHVYPLFENGLRAHLGQSIQDNHKESAQLYASFSDTARQNEFAWNYGKADSAEQIGKVGGKNRMICFPYPLLMNAFNTVNLAGACILTSTELAEELRIPKEKWIYPLGGAGTQDSYSFWKRPNFHSSPAIERSIDTALQVSNLTKEDIDCFDIYSCFPIVPKLAAHHLGFSVTQPNKPLTLLGGLTSFGGAGNNYSMHAITRMVRELRKGTFETGLVLGNGGVLTYQYAVCLSRQPRPSDSPYPTADILPETITDIPVPEFDEVVEGEAIIETYTVEFDRQNRPFRGHIVGRLKSNNHRFLANHGDVSTLEALASWTREPIGREGSVRPDPSLEGRNVFFLDRDGSSKL